MLNLNTEIVRKLPVPIFTNDGLRLAEACAATRRLLNAGQAERKTLATSRQQVLGALINGTHKIPESYDALLPGGP